ncbi:MAG: HAMP domain-containing sensor histidine kinase, partial [Anaerolineales bacterium]|nr:HAMP domain-containing sensor histidine kinase [Anaerolineales bacterium]
VQAGGIDPNILFLVVCGLPLALMAAFSLMGGWAFRRIGRPLSEVMAAADAVADGDLDVRVRENLPGEFNQLARSFNHMTSELQRAERQRRNLTADVAHELRNPLHIIQGNLEGVLDGVYEADPDHIGATLEETRHMARLVADLQTLSLAEAGQLPLHPVDLLVDDLLADVETSFSAAAQADGISILKEVELSPVIHADPARLYQVLSNLVANALRYTPSGGTIGLKARSVGSRVLIVVEDTGVGIAPEDLPYVFDRFWRGDRARTRMKGGGGSGLGLAIARQLIRAHGGEITVESQVGAGTRFKITLPQHAALV